MGVWHLIMSGAVSIAVVLVEPNGLWGIARRFVPGCHIPVGHAPGASSGLNIRVSTTLWGASINP